MPTGSELDIYRREVDADFPSSKAALRSFGGKDGLIARLRSWLATAPAYEDIEAMLPSIVPTEKGMKTAPVPEGFVYLFKSGQYHKVGRSDELERRVNEVGVRLPEPLTVVHSIRTDDPSGIEAYWHRRFADRRVRGEWFKLSSADVAAFRRRTFQ
jgi:hypothetical protein